MRSSHRKSALTMVAISRRLSGSSESSSLGEIRWPDGARIRNRRSDSVVKLRPQRVTIQFETGDPLECRGLAGRLSLATGDEQQADRQVKRLAKVEGSGGGAPIGLRGARDPAGHEAHELRTAFHVVLVDLVEREAGLRDQPAD